MRLCSLLVTGLLVLINVAVADAGSGYQLLRLDGADMKWGKPELGTGAVITYRLADHVLTFDKATNCRQIGPLSNLLEHSHITADQAMAELDAAFAAWQEVANVRFQPARKGERADIIIGSEAIPQGRAFTNVAYAGTDENQKGTDKALTSLTSADMTAPRRENAVNSVRSIAQSLICLNPGMPWKVGFDGDLQVYDLRYALIHEIGHSIGLDHPGARGEIMSFRYLEMFRTPQSGDIAGVVRLYGAAQKH